MVSITRINGCATRITHAAVHTYVRCVHIYTLPLALGISEFQACSLSLTSDDLFPPFCLLFVSSRPHPPLLTQNNKNSQTVWNGPGSLSESSGAYSWKALERSWGIVGEFLSSKIYICGIMSCHWCHKGPKMEPC